MHYWINRITEFTQDWSYLIAHRGIQEGVPTITRELLQFPYRRLKFHIVARSLLEPMPTYYPKIELNIQNFRAWDVDNVRRIDRPVHANSCADRLEQNHFGLMAFHRQQAAGYAWACDGADMSLERVDLDLQRNDALCVDVYTAPKFRNNGIQTAMVLARFRLLKRLGYHRAVAYIETDNYPSLAVWRKVGAKIIGHLDFQRVGVWRQTDLRLAQEDQQQITLPSVELAS